MGKRPQITVVLDAEDLEKIESLCRETGRSKSSLVREIVKRYLKEVPD